MGRILVIGSGTSIPIRDGLSRYSDLDILYGQSDVDAAAAEALKTWRGKT